MRDIVSYVRIAVFERGMMGDGRFFGGFSFFFFFWLESLCSFALGEGGCSRWEVCVAVWGVCVAVGRYV